MQQQKYTICFGASHIPTDTVIRSFVGSRSLAIVASLRSSYTFARNGSLFPCVVCVCVWTKHKLVSSGEYLACFPVPEMFHPCRGKREGSDPATTPSPSLDVLAHRFARCFEVIPSASSCHNNSIVEEECSNIDCRHDSVTITGYQVQ